MILEKTVKLLIQIFKYKRLPPPKVNRIVVGLGYTGVELATYTQGMVMGLANTLPSILNDKGCSKLESAGRLTDLPLQELLQWSYSMGGLQKIVGIATLNAFSQYILQLQNPYQKFKGDILEYLNVNSDSKIFFIGQIKPLIKQFGSITSDITIIEDILKPDTEFSEYSIKNSVRELNDDELISDVLVITGTSLINNTVEDILKSFRHKSKRILMIGPTASMLPDILFDYGVDIVGGMKILDNDSTLKILQEGGGTKNFKQHGKKYYLLRN